MPNQPCNSQKICIFAIEKAYYMSYYKRTADALLQDLLDAFGAVLIEGPKWCGKTTTASQLANSILRMQDPSLREEYLVTAKTKPSILLNGATPRLIDEWQDAPMLWMQYELLLMIVKSPDNLYLQVPMPLTNSKYTILELVVLPDCVCCL